MKQIPFYKGIDKKVYVAGPAIRVGQSYKCVVYSSLTNPNTTIFAVATCNHSTTVNTSHGAKLCGDVTFEFSGFNKREGGRTIAGIESLKEGDNFLAVYDVNPLQEEGQTERTMMRVYDARVYAEDSIANHIEGDNE